MERRRSLPLQRVNTASAPLSDQNTSPLRRKSISSALFNNSHDDDSTNSPVHSSFHRPPNFPLHRTPNASSSPSAPHRRSTADSHRSLNKQRSSDDLQTRILWPSSKKLNPSADAEADVLSEPLDRHPDRDRRIDASASYKVSTFSSRQRISYSDQSAAAAASEDKKGDRGRRSLRYHIAKLNVDRSLKKPGTPPSPSSSIRQPPTSVPVHSGRFSFNETALAKKRSDNNIDFPSTESEQSENGVRGSRVRRPESPARRPGSPLKGKNGGVGSFISQGFNNLFRRKSFQGSSGESVKKPTASSGFVSPGRERATTVKGMGSPGRDSMAAARVSASPSRGAAVAVADGEMPYKLRILHNYLIQWRFVNAGTVVVNKIKCDNAEGTFVNAWLGLSDLRNSVAKKRMQLEKEKLKFKLSTLVCQQTKALEEWGTMEKQHVAALSSTKDSLQAAVCRLPITDHAKVDPYLLSISLRHATKVATAINGNIAKCHSWAQSTTPLAAELSQVVAKEKLLQEECIELLRIVSTLQVHEESLRSNLIQLKSQHLTKYAAKGPSSKMDD